MGECWACRGLHLPMFEIHCQCRIRRQCNILLVIISRFSLQRRIRRQCNILHVVISRFRLPCNLSCDQSRISRLRRFRLVIFDV